MSLLHIAVILPLIFALIIPILYRFFKKIHLGWFVLPIPVVLFIYFLSLISTTQSGNTVIKFTYNRYRIVSGFIFHWLLK